jgi:uncharacterized protein YjiS (DUF1127 family)
MITVLETLGYIAPAKSAAARHSGNPISRLYAAFARAKERRAARKALHALDDFVLRDIGISRCDIEPAIRGAMHRRRPR